MKASLFFGARAARLANNSYNTKNNTKHRVIVYKGHVTAATPSPDGIKSGVLTPLTTEKSVIEYYNNLK